MDYLDFVIRARNFRAWKIEPVQSNINKFIRELNIDGSIDLKKIPEDKRELMTEVDASINFELQEFAGQHIYGFDVEIIESPLGRMTEAKATLFPDSGWKSNVQIMLQDSDARRKNRAHPDLIRVGKWLTNNLLPKNVIFWLKANLVHAIIQGKGLRIVLWLDDSETASLPWEYLYLPLPSFESGFLTLNPLTPIVRDQAFFGRVRPVLAREKRKIMLGIAEPGDLGDLDDFDDINEDVSGTAPANAADVATQKAVQDDKLLKALETLEKADAIEFDHEPNLSRGILKDAVDVDDGYDMFFFYGHGAYTLEGSGVRLANPDDKSLGAIALEAKPEATPSGEGTDAQETTDTQPKTVALWYGAKELARDLKHMGAQVVVLCACNTARRHSANIWRNTVPTLMSIGRIPVVVGIQYKISKRAGFEFTTHFFRELAQGASVEEAVSQGRIAVSKLNAGYEKGAEREQFSFSKDWGLPVLYRNANDEVDLSVTLNDAPATGTRRTKREQLKRGASPFSEDRTPNFTGRRWVFEQINDWLDEPGESRVFWILGPPGSGKTALAMRLAQISENLIDPPDGLPQLKRGFLNAIHLCSKRYSKWNTPDNFAESLILQFAAHSRVYAGLLEQAYVDHVKQERREQEDTFRRLTLETLDKETLEDFDDAVILIDGLDEAAGGDNVEFLQFLSTVKNQLPEQIRFIITADEDWAKQVQQANKDKEEQQQWKMTRILSLTRFGDSEEDLNPNEKDIRDYLKTHAAFGEDATLSDLFLKMSDATFLIVAKMLEWFGLEREEEGNVVPNLKQKAIDDSFLRTTCPEKIDGLESLYAFIDEEDTDVFRDEKALHVLGLLAVAREPLRREQLAHLAGISDAVPQTAPSDAVPQTAMTTPLQKILTRLTPYLDVAPSLVEDKETYTLFHHSLAAYLFSEERRENHPEHFVDKKELHKQIADVYWQEWVPAGEISDKYGRDHLATHLKASGDTERLAQFLSPSEPA